MKPLQTRKDSFYDELIPYVNEYGKDLIRTFYDWWVEHNEPVTPLTKLRFEKQKTWQLSARIKTFKRRQDNQKTYRKEKVELPMSFEQYRQKIIANN